jgi:transcriptional regulator with XRE-family HTH domain
MFFSTSLLPADIMMAMAAREKILRKQQKLSQQELALRSGVSFGSIKRFETSGEISLVSLLKIAQALNCLDDFQNLFVVRDNMEKIKTLFSQ